jgi:predicted nucleic acid-binding protein
MGNLDLMIAAQAIADDLVLITNDQAFKRIAVEDWTEPHPARP